jgi:DNA-binding NarL/FixJ family response regulator
MSESVEGTIRVALVGRSGLETQGVGAILATDPTLDVLPAVAGLRDADRSLLKDRPDAIVVDARLAMPDDVGSLRELLERLGDVPGVVLSDARDEDSIMAALSAGAKGYLLKSSVSLRLGEALRAVAEGGVYIDPAVAGTVVAVAAGRRVPGPFGLTPKEIRVLRYLPRGMSNREIAGQLSVAEETVKSHVRSILRKLGASDRARAAAIAMREGIV